MQLTRRRSRRQSRFGGKIKTLTLQILNVRHLRTSREVESTLTTLTIVVQKKWDFRNVFLSLPFTFFSWSFEIFQNRKIISKFLFFYNGKKLATCNFFF